MTNTPTLEIKNTFESRLSQEGYQEVAMISRDGSYSLGEHTHPFDACALILEGRIRLQVAGVDALYKAGDVFTLPRNTAHHEWAGEQGVTYLAGRRT
jgi:quercetin dioxygenase-like cupin family protein